MKRKIAMVVLSVILLVSLVSPVQAGALTVGNLQPQLLGNSIISPMSLFTNYTTTTLSISSGTAHCLGSLVGYQGTTTSVTIYLYLEKYTSGYWTIQNSWNQSFNDYYGILEKTAGVRRGTYRVKASYYAFSGSNSENIISYSSTVTY